MHPHCHGLEDDVNYLLHLRDVKPFLDSFKKHGEPLRAVMNTEKTQILTSTNNQSTVKRLQSSPHIEDKLAGMSLHDAIKHYSTDKDGNPVEVTDGLRVLGVPIGSNKFCQDFIANIMSKAAGDATALLSGLESEQTMLQLFRQCTVHKLTHLFAADVASANGDINDSNVYPDSNMWDQWTSRMTTAFEKITHDLFCSLTRQ